MKTPTNWLEAKTCPACGHSKYCSVSEDGLLCLCRRGATSEWPVKQRDGVVAYMHKVDGKIGKAAGLKSTRQDVRLSAAALAKLAKEFRQDLSSDRLAQAARSLGLNAESLQAYSIGYHYESRAFTFPMFDGEQNLVGFRLRYENGKKMSVPGSKNGIFIPADFDVAVAPPDDAEIDPYAPMLILMPEGPTDAAAAAWVGFCAIGRPSNNGGGPQVCRLLERCKAAGAARDVVIVADADPTHWNETGGKRVPFWPGWEGALAVGRTIEHACKSLKIVKPPKGTKDLREMVKAGAPSEIADSLRMMIQDAPKADRDWMIDKQEEVNVWKKRLTKSDKAQS